MSQPAASSTAIIKAMRRFRRNRHGSAAVEFALVAPMFFALVFAIIESSLFFYASQVLETGLQDTARLLYTHQADDNKMTKAQFDAQLCSRVSALFTCSGIYTDVKTYAPNATIAISDPIVGGTLVKNFTYQTIPAGDPSTVVVRAFYEWPLYVTKFGYDIANLGRGSNNSKKLLAATAAFHVEP